MEGMAAMIVAMEVRERQVEVHAELRPGERVDVDLRAHLRAQEGADLRDEREGDDAAGAERQEPARPRRLLELVGHLAVKVHAARNDRAVAADAQDASRACFGRRAATRRSLCVSRTEASSMDGWMRKAP